jgi:DNA-binding NarL/FixJ family response regulator
LRYRIGINALPTRMTMADAVVSPHGRQHLHVSVVEDDRATRAALVAFLNAASGFACAGAFGSAEGFMCGELRVCPDVVLLDIDLPGTSGAEAVRDIRQAYPQTEVLMLTAFADEDKVFMSICNGAVGYLLKTTSAPKLLAAIRDAAEGGAPMSPEIARKVVTLFRRTAPSRQPTIRTELTRQETRVLQLLADGHGYAAAAEQLSLSVNTIRTYIRSVYEKLHVTTRAEAVSQGMRRGLIR